MAVEFGRAIGERPVTVSREVPCPDPSAGFVRMTALCPGPGHGPDPVTGFVERLLGRTVSVVTGPAPNDRATILDYLRGLMQLRGSSITID